MLCVPSGVISKILPPTAKPLLSSSAADTKRFCACTLEQIRIKAAQPASLLNSVLQQRDFNLVLIRLAVFLSFDKTQKSDQSDHLIEIFWRRFRRTGPVWGRRV